MCKLRPQKSDLFLAGLFVRQGELKIATRPYQILRTFQLAIEVLESIAKVIPFFDASRFSSATSR